ncbi:MAG: ATPase [Rhodobacteraceae bacterium]|nr:ATPase [Paracoccaceae bacterium]
MNMQNIDVKAPPQPTSLTDTGLTMVMMRDILLKTVFRRHLSTATAISEAICLPINLTNELIEVVRGQKLLEAMGNRDAEGANEMAYELSDTGKARALDALAQSEYYGALPVPLKDYRAQTERQAVKDISISKARLHDAMSHLVLPDGLLDDLGPAINSGKSILMYGPPGNGKSSISNGIRDALGDNIYVPLAIEYMGQVITLYDPIVHEIASTEADNPQSLRRSAKRYDNRYVLCRRPTVITGGELTLDMLDLKYNPVSRTYQASLQLKSTGGVFIVDDLGRQAEPPQALINRWIVPMESGFDILALQSGEKFIVPFDTLVIFSTNFLPSEMFDGAALRRIAYKVKIDGPVQDDFLQIFARVCKARRLPIDETSVVHLLRNRYPEVDNVYANFHAPFLVDQILSICAYEEIPPRMTPEIMDRAWANLFVDES